MRILMAIPCYNCSKQIIRVINKFNIELLQKVSKVILLDNNSSDETSLAALKEISRNNLEKDIHVFRNHMNYGLGGSFKIAVTHASENNFDYLLWFHGDDQAEIFDAIKMLDHLKNNPKLDTIWGARFMKKSNLASYSPVRELGNKCLNIFYSIILKKRIYDLGSGLNIYKVSSLPLNEIMKWPNHIAFDINLLIHFSKNNFNSIFYPISWNEKDQISNANNILVGLKVLWMGIKSMIGLKNISKLNIIELKYDEVNLNEILK